MGNTNPKEVSKYMWKKRTRLYITEKNKNDLLEDIKGYKKLDYNELSKENFERKKYFFEQNIDDVRIMFKIKSEVLPTIRKNFSRKYKRQTLICPSCRNISSPKEDTQKHLMLECPTFASYRLEKDLSKDTDLIDFFKSVIAHRIENNES